MKKVFIPIVILFISINSFVLIFNPFLITKGVNADVVIGGNFIIFATTLLAALMYTRALANKNPQAIIRNVYGGFMLKFFVLLIAALAYISLAKPINKPAFFICMGLYLVYHFVGTKNVLRQKKKNTDGKDKTSF